MTADGCPAQSADFLPDTLRLVGPVARRHDLNYRNQLGVTAPTSGLVQVQRDRQSIN
jgi:hypothetical protein